MSPDQPNQNPNPSFSPNPTLAEQPQPTSPMPSGFTPNPLPITTITPEQPAASAVSTQVYQPVQPVAFTPPQAPTPATTIPLANGALPPYTDAPQAPPQTQPYANHHQPSKIKLPVLLAAIGGGLVVLVVSVLLGMHLLVHPVTAEDVQTAQHAASNLTTNLINLTSATEALDSTSTTDAFNSKASLVTSTLADTQKNYKLLKASPALHNGAIHTKFAAFDKKWVPFIDYIQANVTDLKTLQPVLLKFETETDSLSKSSQNSRAETATYLTNFKLLLDSTSRNLGTIKISVDENRKVLTAAQVFLDSSSQAVTKAQADLAAGKDSFTIEEDLFKVDDAESTFNTALYSIEDQVRDHFKQIDPSTQLYDLDSALTNLYTKMLK